MVNAREDRPTIVIAVDGLRAAALGAYGQTAYETPGFDALAADAVTHDWCYAPTPEPRDLYARIADELHGVTLVTDDHDATAALNAPAAVAHTIDPPTRKTLADSVESTAMASVWAAIAERTLAWAERAATPILWIHTRGLYGPWDAPSALAEALRDEEDPLGEASVAPPDYLATGDELHEGAFDASCRYAGQVITLDACLAGWLDLVAGLMEGVEHRLLLTGVRGFPLGEHGRVGGIDDRLYSEQQQVPLFLRDGASSTRFTRNATPLALDAILLAILSGEAPIPSPVHLTSAAAHALREPDRYLRQPLDRPDEAELYVKPDDRWEQNDIASLEEETVDRMTAMLAGVGDPNDSDVAGGRQHG